MNKLSQSAGFTLIELLITTAVIVVLTTFALANFLTYRMNARNATAEADVRNFMTAQEAYYVDNFSFSNCTGTANCESPLGPYGFEASPRTNVVAGNEARWGAQPSGVPYYEVYICHLEGDMRYAYSSEDSGSGKILETSINVGDCAGFS